ncbi:MAG: mechanosensitive ion channel family protein [Alsobacter sp.]
MSPHRTAAAFIRSIRILPSMLLLALLLGLAAPGTVHAQQAQPLPAPPIRIIIEVPNDEAGRAYVTDKLVPRLGTDARSIATQPAPATPAAPAQPAAAAASPAGDVMMPSMAAERLSSLRDRGEALVMAVPGVPKAIADAFGNFRSMGNRLHLPWLLGALALFMAGGFLARRLAWWSSRGLLARILESPGETAGDRVRLLGMRVSFSIYILTATTLGSVGAFLLFPWPPVFREILLTCLSVFVIMGLAMAFGRVVIAPGARHDYFRVLPISTPLAWFWYRWWMRTMFVASIGWAVLNLLQLIGVERQAQEVVAMGITAILAVMGIAIVWLRIAMRDEPPISRLVAVLLTTAIVAAWLFQALGMPALFRTVLVLSLAPLAAGIVRMSVRNVVRADDSSTKNSAVLAWAVVVERALRVGIVIAGASVLASSWGVDLGQIAMGETAFTRTLRSALRIVIVLLVADLAWRLIRAVLDGQLDGEPVAVHDDSPEARKRQRMRTLLPILRNFLMVMIASISILMVLDALGIQIGPLLAGAGVVGIAIGFGAQTLVKDIISGVFYLLDDAFRVGEYIQAGGHKGTVESFSLRSVKLRHHRGPISTVPFGELGAVQNLSRDWVIDKITIGVTYDTDLDKAKKLIKQIGKELLADPEFAPNIIETLKMQGVEQMGDFAIQLRLKMMTRPGEQFAIRRRAYALMKKAFAENGIKFAFPTVQVAGGSGSDSVTAAAQQAFEMTRPPAPADAKT